MKKIRSILYYPILIIIIGSCNQNVRLKNITGKIIAIDSTIVGDSAITEEILPDKTHIDKEMNRIIGVSEQNMLSFAPESPLSNLVADIIQERASSYLKENKADTLPLISLMNIKGLRAPLPKGNITVRNAFEIMPFENQIVLLTLPGDSIYSLLNFICKTNGEGLSGAMITYRNNTLQKVLIDNKPFDKNSFYYLATSDYLANGGDYFTMITHPLHSVMVGCKIRKSIIDYIEKLNQNNQKVVANIEGRITLE